MEIHKRIVIISIVLVVSLLAVFAFNEMKWISFALRTQDITQNATSTTVLSTHTTISTLKNLATYHSDLYGFDLQYPKDLSVEYNLGAVFLHNLTQDKNKYHDTNEYVFAIFEVKAASLQDWIAGNTSSGTSSPAFSEITINGNKAAQKIPTTDGDCNREVAIYRNGIVFQMYMPNKNCADNEVTMNAIISSFKFAQQTVIPKDSLFMIDVPGVGSVLDSKTTIINNDPVATINHDLSEVHISIVYTTNDKSKTYFTMASYAGADVAPDCYQLNYLDTKEAKYHNTTLQYCPGYYSEAKLKQNLPFVVQYGKFDLKNLYALNLETATETIVYSKKNDSESLIAQCDFYGDYNPGMVPILDIEYLGDKHIRIGIYKEMGQNVACPAAPVKYEKIRDDIINLLTPP